jgi:hypothetical protein
MTNFASEYKGKMSGLSPETMLEALTIISNHNDTTVQINAPVNGSYNNVSGLILKDANAGLIKKLHEAGFSLHLSEKGLSVNKFGA